MSEYSQQFLKRRKFITVLPVIVIPFATIVFWLLGGGSGVNTSSVAVRSGLNMQLPDSKLPAKSDLDKMSFYAMSDKDSLKRSEQKRMDPNYPAPSMTASEPVRPAVKLSQRLSQRSNVDETEERINQRIAALQRKIAEPDVPKRMKEIVQEPAQVISAVKVDPEMAEINSTLEKLLDVQHPERVKERLVEKKANVYRVTTSGADADESFFGSGQSGAGSFYGDVGSVASADAVGVIPAVVHGSQTVQSGYVVKLRLLKDVFVNGKRIVAGSFVFGTAKFEDERMKVEVNSIQFGEKLFPVELKVFDMDGIEGVYIPGSATRETVKQSGDQALQSVGIINMDPSLKAQATAAGIGAAKSLLSKKVKIVRATVKSNYKVLLKDVNVK